MVDLGKNYDRFSDGMFFKLGESETLSARGVEGIKPPSKQEKHGDQNLSFWGVIAQILD